LYSFMALIFPLMADSNPPVAPESRRNGPKSNQHARYAGPVTSSEEPAPASHALASDAVRDPLAVTETVLAARRRPMSERLELALSWNAVAAELRVGLLKLTRDAKPRR